MNAHSEHGLIYHTARDILRPSSDHCRVMMILCAMVQNAIASPVEAAISRGLVKVTALSLALMGIAVL